MTNINDKIEAFELSTDKGKFYSKDHIGKNLVLFFFPKADTTGCTKEAVSFSNLLNYTLILSSFNILASNSLNRL